MGWKLHYFVVVNKEVLKSPMVWFVLYSATTSAIFLTLLTLGAHARGLQYLFCLCVCVCVFSLFWHLTQSGVQTAVSATSARYGHEI